MLDKNLNNLEISNPASKMESTLEEIMKIPEIDFIFQRLMKYFRNVFVILEREWNLTN
jgi:hypothetical protein